MNRLILLVCVALFATGCDKNRVKRCADQPVIIESPAERVYVPLDPALVAPVQAPVETGDNGTVGSLWTELRGLRVAFATVSARLAQAAAVGGTLAAPAGACAAPAPFDR